MTNDQIKEYTNFIYGIMKKFKNYKNKEDLFQAGCIGLINAYNRYKDDMNTKFTTYAYFDILGEMYKLVSQDKIIRINSKYNKLNLKIEKANILLAQQLNRYPTIRELSLYLEIDEETISYCLKINNQVTSLDEVISNDGKDLTLYDTVSDNGLDLNTLISLKQELNNLNDEDRYILEMNLNNYTQDEIASYLGINQVQVSRKLTKIKQRIKSNVA